MKSINNTKKSSRIGKWLPFLAIMALFAAIVMVVCTGLFKSNIVKKLYNISIPEYIDVQYIQKGVLSSRKGLELKEVKNIVVHYVGNPGTTAQQNRDYFSNNGVEVNSHFVVGLDGEIIQCVPLYERSSASNWRNKDTISIEVCHPDETGEFNKQTIDSLIKLMAWLCEICDLDADDIIRHYDITGKLCPLYYVQNEYAWDDIISQIEEIL